MQKIQHLLTSSLKWLTGEDGKPMNSIQQSDIKFTFRREMAFKLLALILRSSFCWFLGVVLIFTIVVISFKVVPTFNERIYELAKETIMVSMWLTLGIDCIAALCIIFGWTQPSIKVDLKEKQFSINPIDTCENPKS
jgi:hypothetical protein